MGLRACAGACLALLAAALLVGARAEGSSRAATLRFSSSGRLTLLQAADVHAGEADDKDERSAHVSGWRAAPASAARRSLSQPWCRRQPT